MSALVVASTCNSYQETRTALHTEGQRGEQQRSLASLTLLGNLRSLTVLNKSKPAFTPSKNLTGLPGQWNTPNHQCAEETALLVHKAEYLMQFVKLKKINDVTFSCSLIGILQWHYQIRNKHTSYSRCVKGQEYWCFKFPGSQRIYMHKKWIISLTCQHTEDAP